MRLFGPLLLTFLLFSCIIFSSIPPLSRQLPPPPPLRYHHIQMVHLWPPTYCISKNCKVLSRENFYLHGLWPADSQGITIISCTGANFRNPNHLVTTLGSARISELDTYWPSITDETGASRGKFWKNEWDRHGKCCEQQFNVQNYFDKGIEHSQNLFDLSGVLAAASIIPSDTNTYSKADIMAAMGNMNVYISCWRVGQDDLLREIHICLDQKAESYISCPMDQDQRGCRGRDIRIPPFV